MIGLIGQVIQTAAGAISGKAKRAHDKMVIKARQSADSLKDEISLYSLLLLLFANFIPYPPIQAAMAEGWRIWGQVTPAEFQWLTMAGIASALGLEGYRKWFK